ncbi:MAG: toll/interleukin-1 receptor domain-containing protein [Anaerolineales bacterium]|nr:toll/interleukin-1 receptor domain-containing protein [Anaerolineales bacterium]
MKQLFISYSRKDTEFARQLTKSFSTQNLEAWVDWQDIPPSVDWMKEIQMGIEQADIFVLIVSPDSIRSDVCAQEVTHAVLNGKRIIPVIAGEIDAKDAPATITHLNWIFFLNSHGTYENAFEKLITAVRTDYDWVQTHRRLQVNALDWVNGKHETSYLLRGRELEDAEAQLLVNSEKSPSPTDLQREYIATSRTAENAQIEQQRKKEQELQLEKNMGVRLKRLTYILMGVFTITFLALFAWLYQVTSELAIDSLKDQMTAIVETSAALINGDDFEEFVNSYEEASKAVYSTPYYSALSRLLEIVKANNSNIATQMALYTIIKNDQGDGVRVIASTVKEIGFKAVSYAGSPSTAHIKGLEKTTADTNIVPGGNGEGAWISACTPILNSGNASAGAVCTDFNAEYLGEIRAKVANTLLITFLVAYPIMIGLILFTTRPFSKSRRV